VIVFIEEQGVPEADEVDDRDGESLHLLAWRGDEAVGTARMRLVGELAKAERVAVRADARGLKASARRSWRASRPRPKPKASKA
jgi:predicted GNAT family N-acyltransferase